MVGAWSNKKADTASNRAVSAFFFATTDGLREGNVLRRPVAPAVVLRIFQGQRRGLMAAPDRFGACLAREPSLQEST